MKTLACLYCLLFIWVNYKMIKATPKGEKFNPEAHNVVFTIIWFFGVIFAIIGLIAFCITYLP